MSSNNVFSKATAALGGLNAPSIADSKFSFDQWGSPSSEEAVSPPPVPIANSESIEKKTDLPTEKPEADALPDTAPLPSSPLPATETKKRSSISRPGATTAKNKRGKTKTTPDTQAGFRLPVSDLVHFKAGCVLEKISFKDFCYNSLKSHADNSFVCNKCGCRFTLQHDYVSESASQDTPKCCPICGNTERISKYKFG